MLTRHHARRLREVYRSAGWPSQDALEIELIAAGLLRRVSGASGHDKVQVTDAGIAHMAAAFAQNRAARSAHELLVERVAQNLVLGGRLAWTGLSVRAQLPSEEGAANRWKVCMPDVFSIRHTSVAEYLEPVVHEIKVSRADLLGDLKLTDKRAAYLGLGGQCWYVLGCNGKGAPIAQANEVPVTCGVLVAMPDGELRIERPAPTRVVADLPFALWMALARATPLPSAFALAADMGVQGQLQDLGPS